MAFAGVVWHAGVHRAMCACCVCRTHTIAKLSNAAQMHAARETADSLHICFGIKSWWMCASKPFVVAGFYMTALIFSYVSPYRVMCHSLRNKTYIIFIIQRGCWLRLYGRGWII